jgi:GxxExxY protein
MKVFAPSHGSLRTYRNKLLTSIKVHKTLGPGLLESVYETCLAHELRRGGLAVETQVPVPIVYHGIRLEGSLKLDVLVQKQPVVEIKAVEDVFFLA